MGVLSKRHLGLVVTEFISSFFVGSVLLIFLCFFLCVFLILVYAFTFLVPCCDVGVNFRCSVHLYP